MLNLTYSETFFVTDVRNDLLGVSFSYKALKAIYEINVKILTNCQASVPLCLD